MQRILDKIDRGFQSSSGATQEWVNFVGMFRTDMTKELAKIGVTEIELHRSHFYVSGFFHLHDQLYYFSISDVRFFPDKRMLIRTAKNNKDFTGGQNTYINIAEDMFVEWVDNLNQSKFKDDERSRDLKYSIETENRYLKSENLRLKSQINKPNEPDFSEIAENALNQAIRYIHNTIGDDSGDYASTWDFDEIEKILEDYAKNNYYFINYK